MAKLLKKSLSGKEKLKLKKQEIEEESHNGDISEAVKFSPPEGDYKSFVSTGSTLLDLNIGGLRKRGGGIPGGIIVEIFGPNGCGKTAILSEVCGSAQSKGGFAAYLDPEGRLDKEYTRIYGVSLETVNKQGQYEMPTEVDSIFHFINSKFKPPLGGPNIIVADGIAALTTKEELESETTSNMDGMRRAKAFSQGFRKIATNIRRNDWVMLCSNQIRYGTFSKFTPGGEALRFHSSLRIEMFYAISAKRYLKTSILVRGVEQEKVYGVRSHCKIVKSSIDEPYRECDIYVVFGYGIDDVRANLQYIKDNTKTVSYTCPDQRTFQSIVAAIDHVERNNLVIKLKNQVIDLWEEIQRALAIKRVPKER